MHKFIVSLMISVMPITVAGSHREDLNSELPRVFEGDVARPYKVVGEIKDNLRKPFAFMPNPTREEIFDEIWERGKKIGADAVINARFAKTKRTLFNHGQTPISGTSIKYTDVGK